MPFEFDSAIPVNACGGLSPGVEPDKSRVCLGLCAESLP